jgi:hypothetical protein
MTAAEAVAKCLTLDDEIAALVGQARTAGKGM